MGNLDGIRVLEAGLLVQGPQAALTMLEWGAEVVKIELPGFGDQSRWLPISREDRRSAWFTAYNRGKRSVTVDLRVPKGREVFLRLVERRRRRHLQLQARDDGGLGPRVRRGRPRATRASSTRRARPSAREGPDATREGADLSAQAAGGLISTTGGGGSDPSSIGATIADHIAGQNLLAGILAALFARERTGRGQLVETSLLGGQIWAQAGEYTRYLMSGEISGPGDRSHPMIPGIYGMFPTSDGWIAIVGVAGPARDLFYRTIGRPDLIDRFDHLLYFEDDKAELWPILDEVFATKTTEEWCDLLGAAGLRFAPVRDHARWRPILACRPTATSPPWTAPTPDVVRPPVRFTDPLGTRAERGARAGTAHRGGAARERLHLGGDRAALGEDAPSEVALGPGLPVETCPDDRRTSSVWALPADLAHRASPPRSSRNSPPGGSRRSARRRR